MKSPQTYFASYIYIYIMVLENYLKLMSVIQAPLKSEISRFIKPKITITYIKFLYCT